MMFIAARGVKGNKLHLCNLHHSIKNKHKQRRPHSLRNGAMGTVSLEARKQFWKAIIQKVR